VLRPPQRPPLFPYTTLFRSERMRLNDGRVLPNFMYQALVGEPITVYGDGQQTRSFCYVSDLVEGIVRLLRTDFHEPVNLGNPARSEEHTSELQSRFDLVCRL